MELPEKLRPKIYKVRDGYTTTMQDRRELYLFLKANPHYRKRWVIGQLGRGQVKWLVGLEAYGDEQGWLEEERTKQQKRLQEVRDERRSAIEE